MCANLIYNHNLDDFLGDPNQYISNVFASNTATRTSTQPPKVKDVHTEHCCVECGCKYGDPDCTVVTSKLTASFECEDCENEVLRMIDWLNNTSSKKRDRVMKAVRVDQKVTSANDIYGNSTNISNNKYSKEALEQLLSIMKNNI